MFNKINENKIGEDDGQEEKRKLGEESSQLENAAEITLYKKHSKNIIILNIEQ